MDKKLENLQDNELNTLKILKNAFDSFYEEARLMEGKTVTKERLMIAIDEITMELQLAIKTGELIIKERKKP